MVLSWKEQLRGTNQTSSAYEKNILLKSKSVARCYSIGQAPEWLSFPGSSVSRRNWLMCRSFIGFFRHLMATGSNAGHRIQSPKKMRCCNKTCRERLNLSLSLNHKK